jgi:flavin reductase (DIM6/NTAB) family NADH-FMN oxidoreductase RutF
MIQKLLKIKKYKPVSQFTAVSALKGELKEKVFLKISNHSEPMNISETHSLLCLNPLILGIIAADLLVLDTFKKTELSVVNENVVYSKINLTYYDSIIVENNIKVILFKVGKSILLQLNKMERLRYILLLYFHYLKRGKKNSISFLTGLAALYSFPREVVVTIIKTESHFNIFPMDLVCEFITDNIIILGLNVNNRSVQEIIRSNNMLIVEPAAASKNIVYGFARNHRKEMIESDFADRYKIESERFHFPVPDFACSYKEISCIKHMRLGSHYLLICKVVNKKSLVPDSKLLYHLSTIQKWHLETNGDPYSNV